VKKLLKKLVAKKWKGSKILKPVASSILGYCIVSHSHEDHPFTLKNLPPDFILNHPPMSTTTAVY
jgi:hypothetical protein